MAERNVAGIVGCERKRDAADLGLHRVFRACLGLKCELARVARASDPALQIGDVANGPVFFAVDRRVARFLGARCRQRLWRALKARCLVASVARLARSTRSAFWRGRLLVGKQIAALMARGYVAGFVDFLGQRKRRKYART